MNKIDEIVIDIEKQKKKESKRKQSTENKKVLDFKYDLNNWLLSLKEKMAKRAYKKALRDITSADLIRKYQNAESGYKILIIYIQAKLKIIENKIFKYHIIQNEKFKHQINSCIRYAKNLPNDLNVLLELFPKNIFNSPGYYNDIQKRNIVIEYTDNFIRCYFDYIYTMALFHFKLNNCIISITYLSFGLELYKIAENYILSPHTLFKIEKSFILLSRIYITNEDYESALALLNDAIKICFKQIIFQVHDIYFGFFLGEKKDIKVIDPHDLEILRDSRMKRIILNIVIIFFYLGICNENMSYIKKATAFYKQCEWFTRIFLLKDNNIIYRFLLRLKKNSIEICNIIDFLQEKIKEKDKKLKKIEEALRAKEKKKHEKNNLFYDAKFKELVKKLEKLKIKEIDTINRFEKNTPLRCINSTHRTTRYRNLFLSNMKLLEAYLTNDFRHIINNMNKINLFDLDSLTRDKVQKAMDQMYFRENQTKIKNENPNISPKKDNFILNRKTSRVIIENEKNNKTGIKHNSKIFESIKADKNLTLNISGNKFLQKQLRTPRANDIEKKNQSILFNKKRLFTSKERSSLISSDNKISNLSLSHRNDINIKIPANKSFAGRILTPNNSPDIQRLNNLKNLDADPKKHYFLNFKYLKKRNFIKKLADREIKFQKCLIRTKKAPIQEVRYFNKGLSIIEADNSFGKIKTLVSNVMINNDLKDNMSEKEYKKYMLRNKMENTFLYSLNINALEKFKTLANNKEKDEFEELKYERSIKDVSKNNKSTLDDLNSKLNFIYEKEQKGNNQKILRNMEISKQIIKRLYKNRSNVGKSSEINIRYKKKLKLSSSIANNSKIEKK